MAQPEKDMSTPDAQLSGADAAESASPAPSEDLQPQVPPRSQYTTFQRVLALLGAIFVIIVTLMYTYSIATGDLFFR